MGIIRNRAGIHSLILCLMLFCIFGSMNCNCLMPFCVAKAENDVITLPEDLIEIKEEAFTGVNSTKVVLPDGIEQIGRAAFANSTIGEINLPESIVSIDSSVFDDSQIGMAVLPEKLWQGSALHEWAVEHADHGFNYLPPADLQIASTTISAGVDFSFTFNQILRRVLPTSTKKPPSPKIEREYVFFFWTIAYEERLAARE